MARDMLLIPLGGNGGGGEQGAQGVQGPRGFQGYDGFQGPAGAGSQGIQGIVGFQGYAGEQGAVGMQGYTGSQGTVGIQGFKGEDGLQGEVGFQGTAGEQGATGLQGAAGLQGYYGFQGVQGLQGPAGTGGSTRLDVSQLSQVELVSFYSNYATEMATKELYWGVYPITAVNDYVYSVQGTPVTFRALTYKLEATFSAAGNPLVNTDMQLIAPDGTVWAQTGNSVELASYLALQGKQDTLTAGEGISIQGTTISATGGGGSNQWFGTQAEFEALQSVDQDTDYFISDPIDYSEIANTPTVPTKISELPNDEGYVTDKEMKNYINERKIMHIVNSHNWYGTQAEYESLQTLNPDTNYHIEGDEVTLQMTFTFTDSTQGVYDVFVKPTV